VTAAVLAQALLVHCLHRSHYQHLLEAAPMSFVLFAWLTGRALFAHLIQKRFADLRRVREINVT